MSLITWLLPLFEPICRLAQQPEGGDPMSSENLGVSIQQRRSGKLEQVC